MDDILGCQEGLPGPSSSKDPLPSCKITGFGSGRTLPAMAGMQGVWEALRGFRRPRGSFASRGKGCHSE